MTTALITHESFLRHETPEGHPERIDRLRSIISALEAEEFQPLLWMEAPAASDEALARAHHADYLAQIQAAGPDSGIVAVDGDTFLSPGTLEAARHAAGAVIAGVDAVMDGSVGNVFCAVRPPGHHAERERAMGFCLYSNAAIGALHALEVHGLTRVAIVDFDVHHGNGTQDVVERDPRIFYVSSHQWPLFPGTGAPHETGVGNVLNVPLQVETGSWEFREIFSDQIMPALERFGPELLIISAGFDAHVADPLAQLALRNEDFAWTTEQLCALAQNHCGGRVVSTLEGGYDLRALAEATAAHIRVLIAHGGAALSAR